MAWKSRTLVGCYSDAMKVVGLLPFRNEARNLPRVMLNLSKICDEILGYDSDSSDGSAQIFQSLGGLLVKIQNPKTYFEGGEHEIRTVLLEEARKIGATHLIFLDCDEYFSEEFLLDAPTLMREMSPGEKLAFEWINLWGDENHYCTAGPWAPRYKDFIMCDDLLSSYSYSMHHVPRSPSSSQSTPWIQIPRHSGVVIHTQFVDQIAFQCKQVLCRMAELVSSKKSTYNINQVYADTLNLQGSTKIIPVGWRCQVPVEIVGHSDWRVQEIRSLIAIHGTDFFEELDIWNLDFMHEIWFSSKRRSPKVANRVTLLILTKLIVYKFRVLIGYNFDR